MDSLWKLSDIPATVSAILDLPFPFSNLGVLHPALFPDTNIQKLTKAYEKNLH
jgi:hypothetical protein